MKGTPRTPSIGTCVCAATGDTAKGEWGQGAGLICPGSHGAEEPSSPPLGWSPCSLPCPGMCSSAFPSLLPGPGPTRHWSGAMTWSQESRHRRRYSGESEEGSAGTFGKGEPWGCPNGCSLLVTPSSFLCWQGDKCHLSVTDLKDLSIFVRQGKVPLLSPQQM